MNGSVAGLRAAAIDLRAPLAGRSVGPLALTGFVVGAVAGSPAMALGIPLAACCRCHWKRSRSVVAHRAAADEQTVALVDALIQRLKGGRSLASALREATDELSGRPGPLSPVLTRFRAALAAGTGLEQALSRAAGWAPAPTWSPGLGSGPGLRSGLAGDSGLGLTLLTLVVLVQRGGPALPALERLDDTLRSAQWVQAETRVQASQATASALALAGLPMLFVVALAALDHDLARFYAFESLGAVCLIGSALLSYIGWWWMHHIVAMAQVRS